MTPPASDPLSDSALAASLEGGFASRHADAGPVRLHYVEGGTGTPVLLLGGWPQTWWQWRRIMPALARRHRVLAVDLRGMGASAKPAGGYDKKTMAGDIRALCEALDLGPVHLVGHDIGAMVAYATAVHHPGTVARLALLDVPHPHAGWREMRLLPADPADANAPAGERSATFLWWFALNQVRGLPERLLASSGGMRPVVDWLADYLAADPRALDEQARRVYARAYADPEAVRAGNAWYQAFAADIADAGDHAPVRAPLLALGGRLGNHADLARWAPGAGTDVRVAAVEDCGHYLPEERPREVLAALAGFLD
ncbi:alpha/beta fold hydrolase [Streptomonospora nanhaiensis]|uniref:Pimeloyl-ACP methyl ester carboxylesterase n=1 Tax=Streptomonospora nanhaiensis TaxID=1323731 RepID=A0A853BHY2_9ACTN|nr:alpha/beta fold hydrolase [Streptomonospora nanhaiensis]MBV2363171.1 alpha/beta fold hydrolase [Streptomonospora nanhaiensis]MBX9387445.1 alpha/beta fold hydrolase [Streptomonospora nanhaiensis]NYI94334.1 pimeloyl-ACP methyl ester carboxylesterase [Streptomonospora nanhaiensis]